MRHLKFTKRKQKCLLKIPVAYSGTDYEMLVLKCVFLRWYFAKGRHLIYFL